MSLENKRPDYLITPHETKDEIRGPVNDAIKDLDGLGNLPYALRIIEQHLGKIEEMEPSFIGVGTSRNAALRFRTEKGHEGLLCVPADLENWWRSE